MCCYEREAFTPNTTITATTAQDGCTMASVDCESDGDKAKMVFKIVNNCQKLSTENQMDELEGKVDLVVEKVGAIEGKLEAFERNLDAVEGKVDDLKNMLVQYIDKTGNLIIYI